MNILVTGATGFIGKALIQELARSSHNVFGLDNQVNGQDLKNLPVKYFFNQDLTQSFHLEESFDYVFHLGALNVTHVGVQDYTAYHQVNVLGTENCIKAVKTRHFVFMSTTKVYREQEGLINEESPVEPKSGYAQSKLEAEKLCRRYFDEKDLTIFRAVNIAGPGQAEKAVIPVFFQKALNDEPLELIYPINTPLQILHIRDLLKAFDLLLKSDQGLGILNLCPEETITLGELAGEVIEICQSTSKVQCNADNEVVSMKILAEKAFSMLEWKSGMSVKDTLREYYQYISQVKK